MTNQGKYPKCEKFVERVIIETISVEKDPQNKWKGVSFLCPKCKTVLSVSIDPIAIKTDIVNAIQRSIGK
jgi:hypothetical protein